MIRSAHPGGRSAARFEHKHTSLNRGNVAQDRTYQRLTEVMVTVYGAEY
jgi:hypothetical protein